MQPTITQYTPTHWKPLWQLRFTHLAEQGIIGPDDIIPTVPGLPEHDRYERDLNRIDEVYLSGGGGFWLAWQREEPVGYVGGQDLGSVIELRRMYVKATHRRQGIGGLLVQALIDHCRANGMPVIELWTEEHGLGQLLYTRLGFQQVPTPGPGFEEVDQATHRAPNPEEIRMRLVL
ncbi:MAG: GNAT family N-acetyltransferase [Caldilineaceae bacterium]|nr:GNAT family N-acetyltransferase [Caldilineaceae bacterium]